MKTDKINSRGRFISLEGQDGAGKTTNLKRIHDFLLERGHKTIVTREPGGTALGEAIRDLLLTPGQQVIDDTTELLLIFAARAQHLKELIIPALENGQWVLSDRFTDASFAYQAGGRGLDWRKVEQLQQLVHPETNPDLTILLDLPISIGKQRVNVRSMPDRFEIEKDAFKQRVRDAYLCLAKEQPERIKIVDASLCEEQVAQTIEQILQKFVEQ